MSKIFITGSSDGLGQLAAKELINRGHDLYLHARNKKRAEDTIKAIPEAKKVFIADISNLGEVKNLARELNLLGNFDVIIHNAGIYEASGRDIAVVNTLAPYILTSLVKMPKKLIYLSSNLHKSGSPKLESLKNDLESINYSDSKLHILLLSNAVARLFPDVYSNAVDPGWVPTKMGGKHASDDLTKGYQTQVYLAVNDSPDFTGKYFYHQKVISPHNLANDKNLQDQFLACCKEITGIEFPSLEK